MVERKKKQFHAFTTLSPFCFFWFEIKLDMVEHFYQLGQQKFCWQKCWVNNFFSSWKMGQSGTARNAKWHIFFYYVQNFSNCVWLFLYPQNWIWLLRLIFCPTKSPITHHFESKIFPNRKNKGKEFGN